jgi:predicted Zn finger-like uncharacterized protein
MIVTCPSCRTRYRHAAAERGARARCSRCDSTFTLGGPAYRLVTPAAAPVASLAAAGGPAMTIGMDDPALAPAVRHSAVDRRAGQPATPMSYAVVAGEPMFGDAPTGEPPPPVAVPDLRDTPADDLALAEETERPAARRHAGTKAAAGSLRTLTVCVLAVAGLGAGAALGFLYADGIPLDMPVAVAASGLCGLLLAAVTMRWMQGRS